RAAHRACEQLGQPGRGLMDREARLMESSDSPSPKRHTAERWLEAALFSSRWLMAPFYVGLVLALVALLVVFVGELVHEVSRISELNPERAILMALSLIDLSSAGNLVLIVIFSGYENFVSKIDAEGEVDRPAW